MPTRSGTRGSASIEIRAAKVDDADMMGRLHVSAWRAAYGSMVSAEFLVTLDADEWAARWRDRLSTGEPHTAFLVATHEQCVVGIAAVGPARTPGEEPLDREPLGELRMLNVAPDWWSRGVGSALHAACLSHLAELGYRRALLWVAADNDRARSFYTRRQWLQGTERKLYHRTDPPLTVLQYHRALDDQPVEAS